MAPLDFDVLVIGAGIAGASLAHFLAPHARVALLEREAQPGYHTTGRSAAMFMESYGPTQVRALTRASRGFVSTAVDGQAPLISPRGALFVARAEQIDELHALHTQLHRDGTQARLLTTEAACARVPVLRKEAVALGAARRRLLRHRRRPSASALPARRSPSRRAAVRQRRRARDRLCRGPLDRVDADAAILRAAAGECRRRLGRRCRRDGRRRASGPGATAAQRLHLRAARRRGHARLALCRRHRRELLLQARCRRAAGLTGQRRPGAPARRGRRGARCRHRHRSHRDGHRR